jgi:hypothetical protein
MWSELRRKLDLKGPIDPDEVAGIPEACTAFEKSAKFSLPESYKSFVATLGPGEIGGYMRIHAPAPVVPLPENKGPPASQSLQDLTEGLGKLAAMERDTARKTILASLVGFASSLGGDTFGWKRDETGPRGEPVIMLVYDDRDAIRVVAESFAEFVEQGCLGTGSSAWFNDPDYKPTNNFFPMRTRTQRTTGKRGKAP